VKRTCIIGAALLASLLAACSNKNEQAPIEEPRIAIAPFRVTGAAESGQHALLLSNFPNVLAAEFGARSRWQVMESERVNVLEEEQRLEMPPEPPVQAEPVVDAEGDAGDDTPPAESAAAWAATFPAADYVLIGQIRGFDIGPEDGRAAGQTLARRVNRAQFRVDVRIVDVRTRGWIASRSVHVNEKLDDESASESQINRAMDIAAKKVVTAVLLVVAREFQVTEVADGSIRLNGGAEQGLVPGQSFKVFGAAQPARIEIVEALPEYAVAKLLEGVAQTGDRVPAQPLEALDGAETPAPKISRVAIGSIVSGGADVNRPETQLLGLQLRAELKARFQNYSGLRVVETDPGIVDEMVGQQLLEDLSKGRDPGQPLGTLHGVDYLILGSVNAYQLVDGRRTVTQMFGTTLVQDLPPQALFDGRFHVLDVNSGEYMSAVAVSADVDLRGLSIQRALNDASRAIGAAAFGNLLLSLRPLAVQAVGDGRVVLNHQRAAGLAVGDRFIVMTPGEDHIDPSTGARMRNVGGREIGRLTIEGFDAGDWAYASMEGVELPPVGARLVRESEVNSPREKVREINW
jgi:curli biogenesis system outer membrane secretion channel CsgG